MEAQRLLQRFNGHLVFAPPHLVHELPRNLWERAEANELTLGDLVDKQLVLLTCLFKIVSHQKDLPNRKTAKSPSSETIGDLKL
jgi:hypothetical protein